MLIVCFSTLFLLIGELNSIVWMYLIFLYPFSHSIWAAITKYHRLGGLNNTFLTVLKSGKSKIKTLANFVSSESPFLICRWHLLALSSHAGRVREFSEVSFIRALIPFRRILPSRPSHLPKPPSLLRPPQWGLGFQHINLKGIQTFSL